jgi:hypothetical protein
MVVLVRILMMIACLLPGMIPLDQDEGQEPVEDAATLSSG